MKNTTYILLLLSSLLFYSCSKEQGCTDINALNYNAEAAKDDGSCEYCNDPSDTKCPNYDPCHNSQPVSAGFDAFEQPDVTNDNFYITTDKFLTNIIKFKAQEENANYTWYIGTETIHSREVVRSFADNNSVTPRFVRILR